MYPGVGLYPRDLDHVSWSRNGILDIQLMYPGEGLYPGDLVHVSSIRILSQISSLCIQVKECILGSSSYIQEQDCILEIQFTYPEVGLHPGDLVHVSEVGLYPGGLVHVSRSRIVSWSLVYVYSSRIVSQISSLCIQEQDCILQIQFMYPGVGLHPGDLVLVSRSRIYLGYLVHASLFRIVS